MRRPTDCGASSEHEAFKTAHPGWLSRILKIGGAGAGGDSHVLAVAPEPHEPSRQSADRQMHGAVMLDENDGVRPALIWCDTRTQPHATG